MVELTAREGGQQQLARGQEAFGIWNRVSLLGIAEFAVRRNEILADTLCNVWINFIFIHHAGFLVFFKYGTVSINA